MFENALAPSESAPASMRWIWKSFTLPQYKFFFSLLLQDMLNTRDLLARKKFHVESNDCVLCEDYPQWRYDGYLLLMWFQSDYGGKLLLNGIVISNFWTCLLRVEQDTKLFPSRKNKVIFDRELTNQQAGFRFFKDNFALVMHHEKPSKKACHNGFILCDFSM